MTINVRELLYFEKPTTRTTFSHIPNGSPDISRMLDGRPAYASTETVSLKMPKTIIVDLRARDLKFLQQRAFDQKIHELQGAGLPVYYFQDERLCVYDPAIINDTSVISDLPSAAQLSKTLGIPVDELFILDHQYADLVMSGFDAQCAPDLSEIISLRPREEMSSVIIRSLESMDIIDALLANFPQVKHLLLDPMSDQRILEDIVNLHAYPFLSRLATLDLDLNGSALTSPQLTALLVAHKPKILSLRNCQSVTAPLTAGISFSCLEDLDLSGSFVSSITLTSIVQYSSQLKILNLKGCRNIKEPFSKELRFPELEALDISCCDMPAPCVVQLLADAKKLKILTINDYTDINMLNLDDLIFPVLEELNFSSSAVNMDKLAKFISISPMLNRLNLAWCRDIKGDLTDDINFSRLKKLDISDASLSDSSIARILTQTKELEILAMSRLHIRMEIPPLHLTQLANLRLNSCNIPDAMLTALLEEGTQLQILSLAFCKNINEAMTGYPAFPKLALLDLSYSSITGDKLYQMLRGTARLRHLKLDGCMNITSLPAEPKLAELEVLNVNGSNISEESLLKLIANSPKLKYLDLSSCRHLSQEVIELLQQQHPDLRIIKPETALTAIPSIFEASYQKTLLSTATHLTHQAPRQTTSTVDADTQLATKTFRVNRIFMGKPHAPQPRDLRYETFDDFELDDQAGIKAPFRLHHQAPQLASCADISAQYRATQPLHEKYLQCGDRHYFCRTNLQLTPEWQALPSAFADETLINFYTEPRVEVELVQSPHTSLHYIRSTTRASQPVILEMLLTRPQTTIGFVNLSQPIRHLARFCRGFRHEALKDIRSDASAQTFLDALITQRVGACRHRSIVFMHLMKTKHPGIPVRLVSNPLHMFAEVFYQDSWISCDLGGYPANVRVNEQSLPEYRTDERTELIPAEVYALTLSGSEGVVAALFLEQAQQLSTLTLKECSALPLGCALPMLDTLNIISCPLIGAELNRLFTLAPNMRTLSIKHCKLTPEEFTHLDFSCLRDLEHVSLSGRFIPSIEAVIQLKKTARQARWIIESDNFSLENIQQLAAKSNIEIRTLPRQLPQRYFSSRTPQLVAKKEAFDILRSACRKTLVNVGHAENARLILQKRASTLGQPVYYIESPDELRCAGPFIRRDGSLGHIEGKPGGPLYDFIMNPGIAPKTIIINYNAFKIADFASFNSLLDDPPSLDGIPLPENLHIIGLLNQHHPDAYQGPDFLSRFDEYQAMHCKTLPTLQTMPLADTAGDIIELCGGEQWDAKLIGHWLLDKGQLMFKEGVLLAAIKAGKSSFYINHAPIHDPKFIRFWHDLIEHRRIIHQGYDYGPLAPDCVLHLTAGVHIPAKDTCLTLAAASRLTAAHVMLNQSNLSQFLGQYFLDESSQQLVLQAGLIEQYQKKVLPIYLSSSLSFFTWLKLLEACRTHSCILELSLAPGVGFPQELAMDASHISRLTLSPSSHTHFNPEESITPDMIIDVSELTPDELLATFKCKGYHLESHQFEFSSIQICPWEALTARQTVVLKGEWSQELADVLQTVMFDRLQAENPPGQLIVYSQTPERFPSLIDKPFPAAMLPHTIQLDKTVAYEERLSAVEQALEHHPFVLLTGATGVGKTHFVSRIWKDAHPACHYGEAQIAAFLEDKSEGQISLYINEANLANKDWTMFEGLFETPPAIFYKNRYYPLTSRHKIIFDGNPITYGGERHTPLLFQRHPYQLHFEPLPPEVLASIIGLDAGLSAIVLEVVMYMASLNPDDTLLTPREIKMMGVLINTSIPTYPDTHREKIAAYFAYTLSKNHVPRQCQDAFEERFKVESPLTIAQLAADGDYLLNSSNLPAAIAIDSHLRVRIDRLQQASLLSLEIGLGGLVIEGESGEGKSQLILNRLRTHGLKKDVDFFHILANAKPNEIKEQLLSAFHQGKIVVIDEINSLPLPEQLLNALLEGHDLEDKTAEIPGFLLFGSQNPISYRGRLKTTAPLEHRLQKVVLPTSSLSEKKYVLEKMGLPSAIAQDIIGEYTHHPDLSFRDVIKIAKRWLAHEKIKPPIQLDIIPVKRVGPVSNIDVIVDVENYYATITGQPPMPVQSAQQETMSILKLAITNGYTQGEFLAFEQYGRTLTDMGFTNEALSFDGNMPHFMASITYHLQQGNLPLIAFPIDRETGLPTPTPKEPHSEGIAVISGYNWQTDAFSLVHSGKTVEVDAITLFNSAHKLFSLTEFKAKLLIVHQPNPAHLLQTRQALDKKPSGAGETLSFFCKQQAASADQSSNPSHKPD